MTNVEACILDSVLVAPKTQMSQLKEIYLRWKDVLSYLDNVYLAGISRDNHKMAIMSQNVRIRGYIDATYTL